MRVPMRVRMKARLMAEQYRVSNPNWRRVKGEWEDWFGMDNWDINLYVNDDELSVFAISLADNRQSCRVVHYPSKKQKEVK